MGNFFYSQGKNLTDVFLSTGIALFTSQRSFFWLSEFRHVMEKAIFTQNLEDLGPIQGVKHPKIRENSKIVYFMSKITL